MYLPIANVADSRRPDGRNYLSTEFYHTLLMSNHNESDPWQFADGIRGKVLWHNEYRMQGMYDVGRQAADKGVFRDQMFDCVVSRRRTPRRPSTTNLRRMPRAQRQRHPDQRRGQARRSAPRRS